MSSTDIDLLNSVNAPTDDALIPAPAPMAMPVREMRTVGGLMISAMSGLTALAPASLAPASLSQRAVVPAVENKATSR